MSRRLLLSFALLSVSASPCFAWGPTGHQIIDRLGAATLPADVPAFLKTPAALDEEQYLGPEPDRWRSPAEPELNAVQTPDHYINFENADVVNPLPRRRYDMLDDLCKYRMAHPETASQYTPEAVGMQPWATEEVWERLKAAFREYRNIQAKGGDTKPVEAAILLYAGWMGHYVADGSQPLHVSRDFNGWVEKENPHGYTTDKHIHWRFESQFVDAAHIAPADVQAMISPVNPIGDEWDGYLAYLRHTQSLTETVYQLDKQGAFTANGTPDGKKFVEERLAAGASMQRDMIYAAWVQSAQPVPERHYD